MYTVVELLGCIILPHAGDQFGARCAARLGQLFPRYSWLFADGKILEGVIGSGNYIGYPTTYLHCPNGFGVANYYGYPN